MRVCVREIERERVREGQVTFVSAAVWSSPQQMYTTLWDRSVFNRAGKYRSERRAHRGTQGEERNVNMKRKLF